jgi:tripartite-type tricarboxylate transporter receptor subunit TctC
MPALRRVSLVAATLIAWTGLAGDALAQKFPEREVRIINPYAPGGSADITGRLVALKMAEILGGQIIVENRPGAGGSIGAEMVAKANPDGYTLLYSAAGPLGVNHKLYTRPLPYDPATAFTPIAVAVLTPLVLAANPKLQANNVKELIELAKKQPGKINFGSAGIGSAPHLTGEMFKSMAKVEISHVPYKGTGPAMADLVGGHIQIMFDLLPAAIQQIKSGTIKALASAGAKRAAALPNVPTVSEQGLPGFNTATWFALVAPRQHAGADPRQTAVRRRASLEVGCGREAVRRTRLRTRHRRREGGEGLHQVGDRQVGRGDPRLGSEGRLNLRRSTVG